MNSKIIILSIVVTAIITFSSVVGAIPTSSSSDGSESINSLGMSSNVDWSFLADESDWGKTKAVGMNFGTYSPSQPPAVSRGQTRRVSSNPLPPPPPTIPSDLVGAAAEVMDFPLQEIPEPTVFLLFGTGLMGLVFVRRRRLA